MPAILTPDLFQFLNELAQNNNREWFTVHKPRYQEVHEKFKAFAQAVQDAASHHDEIERMRVHRIYRDVRFSKDKTPYKQHFSGGMTRATKWRRGSYYFHIESGGAFVGGGFWGPNSDDMKRIRAKIATNPDELRQIIQAPTFQEVLGELRGEQVKTAPKGYKKDHPAIDLLRYKQFLLTKSFSDKEVMAPDFVQKVDEVFQAMRPFLDYMSEVLTTDENGVPIE